MGHPFPSFSLHLLSGFGGEVENKKRNKAKM